MERPPQPLDTRQHRLLIEIIGRHAPHLLPLARDEVNHRFLSEEEGADLVEVLFAVFVDSLDEDDEPSREGAAADDLIAAINMQERSYWES
jgi:hypothetical protein